MGFKLLSCCLEGNQEWICSGEEICSTHTKCHLDSSRRQNVLLSRKENASVKFKFHLLVNNKSTPLVFSRSKVQRCHVRSVATQSVFTSAQTVFGIFICWCPWPRGRFALACPALVLILGWMVQISRSEHNYVNWHCRSESAQDMTRLFFSWLLLFSPVVWTNICPISPCRNSLVSCFIIRVAWMLMSSSSWVLFLIVNEFVLSD